MKLLTLEEREAIREREKKATPGPWISAPEGVRDLFDGNPCVMAPEEADDAILCRFTDDFPENQPIANAEFTAASRTDIPALLSHCDAMDEMLREAVRTSSTFEAEIHALALKTFEAWDSDKDSKVGKYLRAMLAATGIVPEIDAAHKAMSDLRSRPEIQALMKEAEK